MRTEAYRILQPYTLTWSPERLSYSGERKKKTGWRRYDDAIKPNCSFVTQLSVQRSSSRHIQVVTHFPSHHVTILYLGSGLSYFSLSSRATHHVPLSFKHGRPDLFTFWPFLSGLIRGRT